MLELISERRIGEAVANGELDNLPGAGRPLELDDDPLVLEDLRMARRVLKNAGYATAEAEARKPSLPRLQVEARYYRKVMSKLGR